MENPVTKFLNVELMAINAKIEELLTTQRYLLGLLELAEKSEETSTKETVPNITSKATKPSGLYTATLNVLKRNPGSWFSAEELKIELEKVFKQTHPFMMKSSFRERVGKAAWYVAKNNKNVIVTKDKQRVNHYTWKEKEN